MPARVLDHVHEEDGAAAAAPLVAEALPSRARALLHADADVGRRRARTLLEPWHELVLDAVDDLVHAGAGARAGQVDHLAHAAHLFARLAARADAPALPVGLRRLHDHAARAFVLVAAANDVGVRAIGFVGVGAARLRAARGA